MAWKMIAFSPPPAPNTEKAANTTEEITFGDILRLYLEHKQLRAATIKGYTYFLEYTGFAVKHFREVTPDSFLEWYREFAIHAPTQAKKVAALIKSLSRWYCQYTDRPITDPAIKVKTLLGIAIHQSNAKVRKLEMQDFPKFFNALYQLRPIEHDAIMLVLLVAIRRGELFALTADNFTVKGDHVLMTIEQTKNGRKHELPLPPVAAMIVQRRINAVGTGQRLFVMTDNSRIFNKLFEFCGIRLSWHDLRRTWASIAVNNGVSELMIKRVLNHVEQGVTGKHYAHFDYAAVASALLKIEQLIFLC
jgi:integrase